MRDEAEDFSRTLMWTIGMIVQSNQDDRLRIASAYREAQAAVAGIAGSGGNARRRITACFSRSDIYRSANDVAYVGWILTALQERVAEESLPAWQELQQIIEQSVKMLPPLPCAVH